MIFSSLRFEILHRETSWDRRFYLSASNFKITNNKKKFSFDFDSQQWMKNDGSDYWAYPVETIPLEHNNEWEISTEIEIMRARGNGYYGILWGYDKDIKTINCFCLSADGQECLLRSFHNNHYFIAYRFSTIFQSPFRGKASLSILKTRDYYFFSLNKVVIHICPSSKFSNEGSFVGYYLDSDILLRSAYLKADFLITQNAVAKPIEPI